MHLGCCPSVGFTDPWLPCILPGHDGLSRDGWAPCDRIVGDAGSLQSALHLVSKQIRENPPKERPGGPPVTLSQLTREGLCCGP